MTRAWHFLNNKGLLRDGRRPPANGVWLKHEGELKPCSSGLHASVRAIDALYYAPGSVVCLVEVKGEILEESDKLVASERKIIARADATETLRYFARQCALDVLDRWEAPAVMKEYLETGDESLRAAAAAAYATAAYAAYAAADAAYAAYAAADAADAAYAAYAYAAYADAARDKQNVFLESLLMELLNPKGIR